MDIVMIGSGNVAAVLGRRFIAAGHRILQILSRNASEASQLAYEWNTKSANYSSLINKNADVYIIAVSDTAIPQVIKDLDLKNKVVAHTAAAVKMEILRPVTENYGVFYPLQSISKEQKSIPSIPIYTEASNEKTRNVLGRLAKSIYKEEILVADYDKRIKLHLAAVLVNNFTNHIFSLAETYCKKEGIAFKELLPLIENTFNRLHELSPAELQTGPAARKDLETIKKHEALLENYPELLNLYKFLTLSIIDSPVHDAP